MSAVLIEALRACVGAANVLQGGDLSAYEVDWRKRWRGQALAVVRPGTTDEVAAVVRACAANATPVVAQGGNTGLVGAGVPDGSGRQVLLSLTRLNRIREIDRANLTLTAEAVNTAFTMGTLTVTKPMVKSWSTVLTDLGTAIVNATANRNGSGVITSFNLSASVDATARTLTLTALANNTPFTVNASLVSARADIDDSGSTPTTAAGVDRAQVSDIEYADFPPAAGQTFTVVVNSNTYSSTVGSGAGQVAATWTAVLGDLKSKIDAGEAITCTVDDTNRILTLTADAINTAFTVSGVAVTFTTTTAVSGGSFVTQVQTAGVAGTQVTDLTFPALAVSGAQYFVTVNGVTYSHTAISTSMSTVLIHLV